MGAVSAFTTGNYHCKPLMTKTILNAAPNYINNTYRVTLTIHVASVNSSYDQNSFHGSFL